MTVEAEQCLKYCGLLFCDILNPACQLSPVQIVRLRPDLIANPVAETRYIRYRESYAAANKKWASKKVNKRKRAIYQRRYYKKNREKKINYAKARHKRLRDAEAD